MSLSLKKMNKLDLLIKSIAEDKAKSLLAIFAISILSSWLLLFYFFSWEEFSFFYAYQDPEAYKVVFNSHGFLNHPLLRYLGFLFYLFGYNPIPYNILSILTFSLLSIAVYFFSKNTFSLDKRTALFSSLIFAAGYYGIGTFITDTYSGYNGGFGIIFLLLAIIIFNKLIHKFKLTYLLLFILVYFLAIIIFSARTFILPGLLTILLVFRVRNWIKIFFISLALFLPLFIFLNYQQGVLESSLPRINISLFDYAKSLFGNIGYTFFPSIIFDNQTSAILLGILITAVSLIKRETRLPLLLTAASVAAMLVAMLINSQYFSIWTSDNHYMSSFMVFAAPTIAILLKKNPRVLITLIFFIVILSNIEIYKQLQNHSNRLRYFYETIQKIVPRANGKQAVLIYSKYPKPLDPFIHLPEIPSEYYVPGFYHKSASDMFVTQDYYQAIDFINKNKIDKDMVYLLTLADNDLKDVSGQFREIFSKKGDGAQVLKELENLNISGLTPLEIEIPLELPLSSQSANPGLDNFYKWHKGINVKTIPDKPHGDRKKEYLLDNDFETTWIPDNWQSPVSIILNLPESKIIDRIIWSSSRTNPWPQRNPVEYKFLVSNDGINWETARAIEGAGELLKGQYRTEEINSRRNVSFVRMDIYKTAQGALPSIDDFLVIPEELKGTDNEEINKFINDQIQKVCLRWTTNDDSEYRASRQECVQTGNLPLAIQIEPRIEKITGFRVVDKNSKVLKVNSLKLKFILSKN